MQDWKMTDKSAGLENAGLENDGQHCTGWKMQDWKLTDWKLTDKSAAGQRYGIDVVTKPLARLLEPLRIATILNIYLSNGM